MRVLETHCGDARAASSLLPTPSVSKYTAADFSEGMLTAAQVNLGERGDCQHCDATSLPFEDSSFDRYLSNLGLCCTSDLTAKLSEARRVLAADGMAAMSCRIEGGEGDTSFKIIQQALSRFGLPPGPDREGLRLGKDLPALRARVAAAGFAGSVVAWRTFASLPIHDPSAFLEFATSQPPIKKFLATLEATGQCAEAEQALAAAAAEALAQGAIQIAVAVVVAKCSS